jgi:hypothetical protein
MNKKQKTEKCREILYKYSVNENISNDEDIQFLLSIFENHSEWDSKQGVGIKSISVIKNQFNKCFQLNRIDGTFTDISFTHSISNRSKVGEVKKACRTAIRKHIVKFRDESVVYGVSVCPITNEVLTKENTHIDHYDLTFDLMFNLWVVQHDFDFLFSKVNETKDNCVVTCFTDASIIEDFINFHNLKSKLRAVSKNANLSILKYLTNAGS